MWFAIVGKRTTPRHDRADAVAVGEALTPEGERLVVADARGSHELRPRPVLLVLDEAGSETWPPPSG